jgi:hypothetical protein
MRGLLLTVCLQVPARLRLLVVLRLLTITLSSSRLPPMTML